MANKNKEFNYGLYAVLSFILVAAILATTTVVTFKNKYLAFSPEKIAVNYVDAIAQRGDGYNAYKYTLVSKSSKYGDFIREYYIYPAIYPGYSAELDKDAKDAAKENGLDTDEHKGEKTLNDDGTLAGQVTNTMYDYYLELMKTCSWDNYSVFFTRYMEKLQEVRKDVFGDDYMTDEIFFTALEANVATFGDTLTGTDTEYASDGKTVVKEATTGVYQVMFGVVQTAEVIGEGGELVETEKLVYKLSTTAGDAAETDLETYKATRDAAAFATYGVDVNDISAVSIVPVTVALEDGTEVATVSVVTAKIGNTWYVDSTASDMSSIYALQEGAWL